MVSVTVELVAAVMVVVTAYVGFGLESTAAVPVALAMAFVVLRKTTKEG